MEGQSILVAVVTIVPTTIASMAAWRAASKASHQTNGLVQEPLRRIEESILYTHDRLARVEDRVARVEVKITDCPINTHMRVTNRGD